MKNRILISLMLAAVMTVAAVGCGKKDSGTAETEAEQTESAQTEEAQSEAAQTETEQSEGNEAAKEEAAEQPEGDAAAETDGTSQQDAAESDEANAGQAAADSELKEYVSDNGWSVRYDSGLIGVGETDAGVVFDYKGESSGANRITISYVPGEMPDEALYDFMAGEEGFPDHERSESSFAGRDDVWALRIRMAAPGDETGGALEYIATEHNGGTIVISVLSHPEQDEERGMAISDTLAGVLDSFTFTKHDPQTWYDYVPGKYVQKHEEEIEGSTVSTEYFVQLNADHTGTVHLQDDIPVIWYCREGVLLNAETGEQIYEYVIEGESLMLLDPEDPEEMGESEQDESEQDEVLVFVKE